MTWRLGTVGIGDGHRPCLAERAPCVLEDLAAATGSRVRLGVLRESDVLYIEKRPGRSPATSFTPAATVPVHPTAVGRVLLAFAPSGMVELTILRGLRRYTVRTVTSPERFRRALAVARLTRVAITRDEFDVGVRGVAVPVFGTAGAVLAGLEVARGDLHNLQPVLSASPIASRILSRELTGNPHPAPDRVSGTPA